MSTADGSLESVLGGVTEQTPLARLSGQLEEQTNMLSDVVTGLRRRPGVRAIMHRANLAANRKHLRSQFVEAAGSFYTLVLNTLSGWVSLYNKDMALVAEEANTYLINPNGVNALRITNHAGSMYVLNPNVQCSLGGIDVTKQNPNNTGFFYIRTGAFNKTYEIKLACGGMSGTYTYTTPAGTDPTQVAAATPEGIATALANLIFADPARPTTMSAVSVDGAYVWLSAVSPMTVTTNSGQQYMMASNAMQVNQLSDLPAKLHPQANGAVCAVGLSEEGYSYFRWDTSRNLWKETSSYNSAATINGAPLKITVKPNALEMTQLVFEGRVSGNDTNNPYPKFMTGEVNMTGLFSYQGRLGILAETYINMSANAEPARFMRSTTTTILQNDPIETGSGGLTSASFEYAVPYNKDLLIFANTHQAIITPGSSPVSPLNCVVSVMGRQDIDTHTSPTQVGKSLVYASLLSNTNSSLGEYTPSTYSNSNYFAQNLTDHLPGYFKGRVDLISGSQANSFAVLLLSDMPNSIYIYEYIWKGEERTVASWHRWDFNEEVLAAHFSRDELVVTLSDGAAGYILCSMVPRTSRYRPAPYAPVYLDMYGSVQVTDGIGSVPVWLRGTDKSRIALVNVGSLEGEEVGIEYIDDSWNFKTVPSFQTGSLWCGSRITSSITLSPPVIRSKEGVPINQGKVTLLRYVLTLQNSGAFTTYLNGQPHITTQALRWASKNLKLNEVQLNEDTSSVIVPIRALAYTTDVRLVTNTTRELNLISVEYTLRFNSKRQRL